MTATDKVLFVDDEPRILEAYRRSLRKVHAITTASSGADGLRKLEEHGPFAIVVSDMQMPEMNGVEFLREVKKRYPDVVRLMLTGNADQQTAVSATNDGEVYKFLNKPCSADAMVDALKEAMGRFQAAEIERALLRDTLNGSVKALIDVLSMANPRVFSLSETLVRSSAEVFAALGEPESWETEASAHLCLLGLMVVSPSLVDRWVAGEDLTEAELDSIAVYPEASERLIAHIPRLESVASNVRLQLKHVDGGGLPAGEIRGEQIPLTARVLNVLLASQRWLNGGLAGAEVIDRLRGAPGIYDGRVVDACVDMLSRALPDNMIEVSVLSIEPGMKVGRDLSTRGGILLVAKGQSLSASLCERLRSFYMNKEIEQSLLVLREDAAA